MGSYLLRIAAACVTMCALVLLIFAGNHDAFGAGWPAKVLTFSGESANVGSGTIRTWVTTDAHRKPLAIGIIMTEDALVRLGETDTEYPLSLPTGVQIPPYTHFVLNWNPHGHIPAHIYDVPHFDFHFYLLTREERDKITATGDDLARTEKPLPLAFTPLDYFMAPGGSFPRMGAHWVDKETPELHEHPFTSTFVYGSYNGAMAFLEPMITTAFLATKPNFSASIKQPEQYQQSGYYPTRYAVKYNTEQHAYYLALQGLTWHKGAK